MIDGGVVAELINAEALGFALYPYGRVEMYELIQIFGGPHGETSSPENVTAAGTQESREESNGRAPQKERHL